jgi:hypothetical protein
MGSFRSFSYGFSGKAALAASEKGARRAVFRRFAGRRAAL